MIPPRGSSPQHHTTLYLSGAGDCCADTDSVCSTVLAASHEEEAHAHNNNKKSLTRTSSKKTVRFSTSRHQVYYPEDDHRDASSCWYTAQDFQRFKAQRVQTVRKLVRQQPHVVRQLEDYLSLSGQSSLECRGDLLLSIPTAWCGLERVSVKALAMDKMDRKQQLYEAMLEDTDPSYCRCAACRREVSREITAPAVRLARALATL